MRGVWMHDPTDPEQTMHWFRYNGDGATDKITRSVTHTQYAGRKRPVADFGTSRRQQLQVTIQADDETSDWRKLTDLFDRQTVLCYRDGRGRRLFGTISELSTAPDWWGVVCSFTFDEVDWDEAV